MGASITIIVMSIALEHTTVTGGVDIVVTISQEIMRNALQREQPYGNYLWLKIGKPPEMRDRQYHLQVPSLRL